MNVGSEGLVTPTSEKIKYLVYIYPHIICSRIYIVFTGAILIGTNTTVVCTYTHTQIYIYIYIYREYTFLIKEQVCHSLHTCLGYIFWP